MGEPRRAMSVTADHVIVDDQRVEDRFLDGLHDRGVERVHAAPRDKGDRAELVVADWADGKGAGQRCGSWSPGHSARRVAFKPT
jgi:hypothetical protein